MAVIGTGHLGRHHARLLAGIDGAQLAAVVDTDLARAAAAAGESGARVLADYREILGEVDAVTVAVPTELHHEIALPFLSRGVSVLVEKPITRTLAEADALIAAATGSGATLATGHTERHNPAVALVMPLVTTPRFIEVHRLGAFPDRSLDIDVVLDLMLHDLDLILAPVEARPTADLAQDRQAVGCRRAEAHPEAVALGVHVGEHGADVGEQGLGAALVRRRLQPRDLDRARDPKPVLHGCDAEGTALVRDGRGQRYVGRRQHDMIAAFRLERHADAEGFD